jgi:metallo-beta-lactamase family protein
VAKISGRASEIQYSNIPEVSTEMEMEEALKVFDEDYRQMRHKVLQYVIRQPKAIDGMVKVMQKLRNYMKKLMASYNIG